MTSKILVFLALCFSFNAMSDVTIGLINLQKVLNTIKEGKVVNDKLKKTLMIKKQL